MKLILHDLTDNSLKDFSEGNPDIELFCAVPKVKHCTACFGCWLKTPGMCVIDDRAQEFMNLLVKADEFHVVSRLLYGGLSTEIKAVIDRSLGYILPYFDIEDGHMHHPPRYNKTMSINYHLYPYDKDGITDSEMETMRGIARANAVNMSLRQHTCNFYKDINELRSTL